MTGLELQQRGLLALIKGRGAPPGDPYLQRMAGSRELAMIREIALWWRTFQLEAQCRFTSRLLKRLGTFPSLVAAYFDKNATSPFVEELSLGFLRTLRTHDDPLVRAVSQFESGFCKRAAAAMSPLKSFGTVTPISSFSRWRRVASFPTQNRVANTACKCRETCPTWLPAAANSPREWPASFTTIDVFRRLPQGGAPRAAERRFLLGIRS